MCSNCLPSRCFHYADRKHAENFLFTLGFDHEEDLCHSLWCRHPSDNKSWFSIGLNGFQWRVLLVLLLPFLALLDMQMANVGKDVDSRYPPVCRPGL